jgi:acyl-CoA hydrolase
MQSPRAQPQRIDDVDRAVDAVLSRVGSEIVLGLPLGLGKANLFANALFARALQDRSLHLRIITALTLERPRPKSELERRFLEPFVERVFGNYPELAYCDALRRGVLPDNIDVSEFFLLPGAWLTNDRVQQSYIAVNYTHAARVLVAAGCNVVAQIVGRRGRGPSARFSLSSNPEMTLSVVPSMRERAKRTGKPVVMLGEVNQELPFIANDAEVATDFFDVIFDPGEPYFTLFSLPHQPISIADYAVGFHAASLVEDGGTLQIGIGSLGDAIARCLIVRHERPERHAALLTKLPIQHEYLTRESGRFERGLYGCSEMVVDGLIQLIEAGILTRRVFPSLDLEQRHHAGEAVPGGVILHGGFFLGSRAMYERLKAMPADQRALIDMTRISFVNQLYGQEELKRSHRQKARFINTAMMMTLNGAATSDGLEDGRVVSGVGGQYNFVAMAHELEGARSILAIRATREDEGVLVSNILWSYGYCTIPRHLRDIVVSEYGIADLRGKTDRECVMAMLNIADSRFQATLLGEAKRVGKIEAQYEIPPRWRDNYPSRLERELGGATRDGLLPMFPFGTEFTDDELELGTALKWLEERTRTRGGSIWSAGSALVSSLRSADATTMRLLARMQLDQPKNLRERLYQRLVRYAILQTRSETSSR